jgi:hypothetical protein
MSHYVVRFILAALAIWRLTSLLAHEDGPWNIIRKFRRSLRSWHLGEVVSCFYCLSVWIALPFAWFVGGTPVEIVVVWWALSGAAILLERVTDYRNNFGLEENGEVLQEVGQIKGDTHDSPAGY